MDPKVTKISDKQVQLYDEQGRLIGVISRPVVPAEAVGPGREKVYLARRDASAGRAPHAA
jgi:hypothetical protein